MVWPFRARATESGERGVDEMRSTCDDVCRTLLEDRARLESCGRAWRCGRAADDLASGGIWVVSARPRLSTVISLRFVETTATCGAGHSAARCQILHGDGHRARRLRRAMRRAIARALADASLPRRCCPSARVHAWRARPSRSAPRRSLSGCAEAAELDALVASQLAAAACDPDVVARVLPHLPRARLPRLRRGRAFAGDGWASPSSSGGRPTRVARHPPARPAVAAWLLKSAGFDVTGVLMRN